MLLETTENSLNGENQEHSLRMSKQPQLNDCHGCGEIDIETGGDLELTDIKYRPSDLIYIDIKQFALAMVQSLY